MYIIGRVYQSLKYRFKELSNPMKNWSLKLRVPNLDIHRSCTIGKVKWGHTSGGSITLRENTKISDMVCIMPYGGNIDIGKNCSINAFCHINGNGGLTIGNNVRIASNTVIIPANHSFERKDIPITNQGETRKGISIEDDVWLGAGVVVLDGVTIGRGSVIGAGSVVSKSVPAWSVAVGVPAKVIKKR